MIARAGMKHSVSAVGVKKIVVCEEVWEEVEKAVAALGLFEQEELPRLTHGICDGCYKRMSE